MAKRNINYIAKDKLVEFVQKLGCKVQEQKGFVKVTGETGGRALYIGNTKMCGRIDLSGFTHKDAVAHERPPTKRVEQWIDFTRDEKAIFTNLFHIVKDGLMAGQGASIGRGGQQGAEGEEAAADQGGVDVDELIDDLENGGEGEKEPEDEGEGAGEQETDRAEAKSMKDEGQTAHG